MPRSSESVGALASALAKAQAQLVNPEKSLTGVIRTGRSSEGEGRSFRYAPLSSGLDIVHRTLGQHVCRLWKHTRVEEGEMPADAPMQSPETGVATESDSLIGAGGDVG
jgi:hypothetical protein